jgi:hypothetical protein
MENHKAKVLFSIFTVSVPPIGRKLFASSPQDICLILRIYCILNFYGKFSSALKSAKKVKRGFSSVNIQ